MILAFLILLFLDRYFGFLAQTFEAAFRMFNYRVAPLLTQPAKAKRNNPLSGLLVCMRV